MITLSKSGSTVTFTFDENSGYLQNGTIDVPVNSLSLIIDESDMATFRKAASNDIFISARYEEFGMSKADLEAWYKENMVGATGGGGGVTSGEVQTMIDENISGITDDIDDIELAVAGAVNDLNDRIDDLSGNSITSGDVQNAISGKVDTTVYTAYTAATDSVLSGKQKTIEAGRGISLTTGATADTVSLGFPISAGTGVDSLLMSGSGNTASGNFSVAYGKLNTVSGECGVVMGNRNTSNNFAEFAIGQKNVSRTEDASAFGHSGNTLFSVGNGIINEEQGIDANHNAFEIRGNGDIYIADTNSSGGYYQKPMIKLQDAIGGAVSSAITSGDTNAVAGGAVYDKFDEVEQVTAAALNNINDRLSEDEEVTAAGLNAVNSAFGGLKLQQISQSSYDSLVTKDASTLYIIVN